MTARRRRPGEGSIRKRANGSYEARYIDPAGVQRSLYRKTEDEARRALTAVTAARDEGVDAGPDRQTVEAYLGEWLSTHIIDNDRKRPATQRTYASNVRTHLIPILGRIRMTDLRDKHLRELHRAMAAKGSAPGTIRAVHQTLSAALAAWVRGNPRTRVNVALLVNPPTRPARSNRGEPIRIPTDEEIVSMLEHLRDTADDLEPLYRLTVATGLRQGEAMGLRWGDLRGLGFHLTGETPLMMVRRTIDPHTRKPGPTKSAAGVRTLRLSSGLMTILADHYRRMTAQGRPTTDDDYVFTDPDDYGPYSVDKLRAHLYRTQAAAGVEKFRWHDFRHYLVTKRLARGDNLTAVSRSVGHARVATTVDLYDQVAASDLAPLDELDAPPRRIVQAVEDRTG